MREAIHRLEQEGLVQLTPNKGAVVVGVSEKDLRDIYDIRMKLEGLASRWAAEQITEEDAKSLRDILELQEFYTAKGDLDQLRNLDSQFHERIYEISGSRTLRQTLSSLHHSIQRYRKMSFATKGRAQKVMGEHQRIVDAIAAHNPADAEKATIDHIEMAATNMLKNLGLSSEEGTSSRRGCAIDKRSINKKKGLCRLAKAFLVSTTISQKERQPGKHQRKHRS